MRNKSTFGRIALTTALGLMAGGCYTGFQDFDGDIESGGPGVADGDAGGEDAGEDGGEDGGVEAQCEDAPRQIGATSLRRMSQSEYRNTIDELLGIETSVTEGFAPDERVGPFKTNVEAPVADLQVEQYMDAAEVLAEEYVLTQAGEMACDPEAMDGAACAEQWLREFMPRAYRRPVGEGEIAELMAVYEGSSADGFELGVQTMLQTMLQSPFFLYHVERGEASAEGGPRRLTGHELASRLSYFLWNGMPDATLFAAAESGQLDTAEGLQAQVDRMLMDPRAEAAIEDFHLQWLGVDEIETLEKDTGTYPAFDSALAQAMKEDTARFARWVFAEGDGRLETLLTGAFTLSTDPALLALYDVEVPADHEPGTPLALPEGQRAGVLTQPAVMAWYGHADQSSPVHRGKLVRENFLCQTLPPPPEEVDSVPPDPEPGATTRERFDQHVEDPSCAACHKLIDGVGFGFEAYDGIGAFRTEDQGLPVDASGELVQTDIDTTYDGAVELSGLLAGSGLVQECVSRQWFRYALGRMEQVEDTCATQELASRFADSDNQIRSLIHEIVASDAFRYRRAADESAIITEGE